MSSLRGGTVKGEGWRFQMHCAQHFLGFFFHFWSILMWIMERNFEISPIRTNLERQKFWNPDAIRTKSDKIWLPLSGHKWLAAIRVPHLYSGVLGYIAQVVKCLFLIIAGLIGCRFESHYWHFFFRARTLALLSGAADIINIHVWK